MSADTDGTPTASPAAPGSDGQQGDTAARSSAGEHATSSSGSRHEPAATDAAEAAWASPHVLREYALLADGERGALLGPRGDVAWLCVPRWDSGSVFGSLIGAPGHYGVTPVGRFVWGGHYEDASLIWRSRWMTGDGPIECREALALPAASDRVVLLPGFSPTTPQPGCTSCSPPAATTAAAVSSSSTATATAAGPRAWAR